MLDATLLAQAGIEEPCGPTEDASALCEAVLRLTNNDLLARSSDLLLVRPARIALIVVLALVATWLLRRGIRRFVSGLSGEAVESRISRTRSHRAAQLLATGGPTPRASQRATTIGAVLTSMGTFVVWSVATLTILGEVGVDIGPLVAGAGIVGVAVGFGAQNLVRDFLSGIFMLVEDQYGVGDVIDAGPASGVVEGVSLRTTRLRDVEGNVWHIPNGGISRVANKSQQWSRAVLDVGVSYATDTGKAVDAMREVAAEMWRDPEWAGEILEEPEVWGVENLGPDGVDIRLVVKTKPLSQWNVARELRARIKARFDEEGIEIPFPQRTIWHRSDDNVTVDVGGR